MPAFHIVLEDEGTGTTRVDFEAESRDFALAIAQGQSGGRTMELWEGATLVGTLHKAAPNLWNLG